MGSEGMKKYISLIDLRVQNKKTFNISGRTKELIFKARNPNHALSIIKKYFQKLNSKTKKTRVVISRVRMLSEVAE